MAMVRRGASARKPTAVAADRTGAIVLLYFIAVVFSEQPAVEFAGLILTPVKILLLVAFIPAVATLLKVRDLKLQIFDCLIVLMIVWLFLGLLVNNGLDRAVKYGGSLALEVLGGYLIARAYVRTPSQFARAVQCYVCLVAITGAFALPETLFGLKLFAFLETNAVAPDHFGLPLEDKDMYIRLGLQRASVTFDHPILYGVFCATSIGLAWYAYVSTLTRCSVVCVVASCTFLSLSSAPLLACAVAVGFIFWEKLTRFVRYRAAVSLFALTLILALVQAFASRSLVAVILPFVAFNQWTAYFRLLIWEHATANIWSNPLFGIGLNDWARPTWMPSSVDNFWLVIALTGGLPAVIALLAAVVMLLIRVHVRRGTTETRQRWQARFGWTAAVLALCVQASTVHYWGAMHSFFYFVLGLGAWLSDARMSPAPEASSGRSTRVPTGIRQAVRGRSRLSFGRTLRSAASFGIGEPQHRRLST